MGDNRATVRICTVRQSENKLLIHFIYLNFPFFFGSFNTFPCLYVVFTDALALIVPFCIYWCYCLIDMQFCFYV